MKLSMAVLALWLGIVGSKTDQSRGPDRGKLGHERNDCRPATGDAGTGSCEVGLLCLSNLCVRPPPADCKQVAERLASMELGNYAPIEERKAVVAKYQAACNKARVSKEEGECLSKTTDEWSAAQCVPRLFPERAASTDGAGDCDAVADKIRAMVAGQGGSDPSMQKMISQIHGVMKDSCQNDSWPEPLKQCILKSSDDNAMDACKSHFPPELEKQLQERVTKMLQ